MHNMEYHEHRYRMSTDLGESVEFEHRVFLPHSHELTEGGYHEHPGEFEGMMDCCEAGDPAECEADPCPHKFYAEDGSEVKPDFYADYP